MSRRSKFTDEERITAVQEYLDGKGSYHSIANKHGIDYSYFRKLVILAQTAAVKEYLDGKGTLSKICAKYKITSDSLLRNWISCYNSGKDLKERTRSERGITMKKGRKTTQEERTEIVAFCIENGKDYGLAMKKYDVSYQQIYSWVRKYEEKGVVGLSDRRGKAKPKDELTEADRLRMENKILQAKIKDQEMEIKLLKKLKELEGGDW
jgi:transposase-like protein